MTNWVDIELDEEVLDEGQKMGLFERREDGHHYLSKIGSTVLKEYLERTWKELPICPKCEQKAFIDNDYICKSCRYGYQDGLVFTGY